MLPQTSTYNLQLSLDSNEGRRAVLSEILCDGTHGTNNATIASKRHFKGAPSHPNRSALPIKGKNGRSLVLVSRGPETRTTKGLAAEIFTSLESLTDEEKRPILMFVEGLSYNFNNIFMGIIGNIALLHKALNTSAESAGNLQ